ncbi:hypothetical protein B0T20DRAFT_464315 [Sordaria brevicollis]|uniref:Uncharacterized protein n=1 Tax=Sordaria brevicollis TaxID=83679 RepID=A0AAE0U535_SORBR|nr:hypothetical protein B0T20DRAFT_464315 [Sordaria brevicollis]
MANKKKKSKDSKDESMPLFSKFPAEIQLMIFHEALRKPQVHFLDAKREKIGQSPPTWSLILKPKHKNGDTSGYRLFNNIEDMGEDYPVAAEVLRKNLLEPHDLPLQRDGDWTIDAATDLVVLEFGPDKSGSVRLWHPKNRISTNIQDVTDIRQQLEGIRKFCPEELLGLIYHLSHIETVYFILHHKVNAKVVEEYAANYFSVPAATRNRLGFKTFYSTTKSYITVPLPSYKIGPVYRPTWKAKDSVWPENPPLWLIKEARETVLSLPPDSNEKQYAEHARKLSRLALKLDHRSQVTPLISEIIRQMRMDQNTPLSPDGNPEYEWPLELFPDVITAEIRALQQEHRRQYNLDNLTKERRDNLEFGLLLMVNDTAVRKDEEKDKGAKSKAGGGKKKDSGKSVA